MKRSQSALLLRSMANSIQHSLQKQTQQRLTQHSTLVPTRSEALLPPPEPNITDEQRNNRIFILEKQIAYLERELQNSKQSIRSYAKQLTEYENTTAKIASVQKSLISRKEAILRVKNQMSMLQEQFISERFNCEERIAEKQYYQQLIETYSRQFEAESKGLLTLLQLEKQNQILKQEVADLEQSISRRQGQLQDWKEEINFDLSQCKLRRNLQDMRMQLIALQDQCDIFCQQQGLRKVRELLCLFFKNYFTRNGISNSEAEHGLDLFICKRGLAEDVAEFIRQKLVYNKPNCKAIDNYLQGLQQMEQMMKKNGNQQQKKLYDLQIDQVSELHTAKTQKQKQIQRNDEEIKAVNKKIDDVFGHDSLAVIEYLRQKSNRYDVKEIKTTLKEHKKEQELRMQHIRQAFKKAEHLEKIIQRDESQGCRTKNQKISLELMEELFGHEQQLLHLKDQLSNFQGQKEELQTFINNAISKWRERDQNKIKLKQLYQELNQTKKNTKNTETVLRQPAKSVHKMIYSDCPLASSRQRKHSKKNSVFSINQSKSQLSLGNPFEKIMKRETAHYQPILSDCQLIISKRLLPKQDSKEFISRTHIKQLTTDDLKMSQMKKCFSKSDLKITKVPKHNKENELWDTRTKYPSQSKGTLSLGPSSVPTAQKGKISASARTSLSKLLISKFHR